MVRQRNPTSLELIAMRQRRAGRIALDLRGLMGRSDIFRLSGSLKRDPAVDMWLSDEPVELRSIAQKWFTRMRQCGDDVRAKTAPNEAGKPFHICPSRQT